jgi:superfamily II RNA helicase
MEEHKISISRSDAFRSMPLRHKMGGMDKKLLSSLKEDGMLEDENETAARERLLEAQYGASALRNVMNPRFMRDREGKQFRQVQQLDGVHIDRAKKGYELWPLDPDSFEKEGDMVDLLRSAVLNSEKERNKYLTADESKANFSRADEERVKYAKRRRM